MEAPASLPQSLNPPRPGCPCQSQLYLEHLRPHRSRNPYPSLSRNPRFPLPTSPDPAPKSGSGPAHNPGAPSSREAKGWGAPANLPEQPQLRRGIPAAGSQIPSPSRRSSLRHSTPDTRRVPFQKLIAHLRILLHRLKSLRWLLVQEVDRRHRMCRIVEKNIDPQHATLPLRSIQAMDLEVMKLRPKLVVSLGITGEARIESKSSISALFDSA